MTPPNQVVQWDIEVRRTGLQTAERSDPEIFVAAVCTGFKATSE
jgi:hypothetical protein